MDVLILTYENIPEIARRTGRSEEELKEQWYKALGEDSYLVICPDFYVVIPIQRGSE